MPSSPIRRLCRFAAMGYLATAFLSAPIWAQNEPAKDISPEQFVEFVRTRALPIEADTCRKLDPKLLDALDRQIADARLLFLGEGEHHIHEKFDYRLGLIEHLFEHGWRHIGMEMGRADAKRIDAYLQTGDTSHLDRLPANGFDGDQRSDREDRFPGFATAINSTQYQAMRKELRWFYRQLYELNANRKPGTPPLHWFGYDLSFCPGGSYTDANAALADHADAAAAQELRRRIQRVPDESRAAEVERLRGVLDYIASHHDRLADELGRATVDEVDQAITCLADGLAFLDGALSKRGTSAWPEIMASRERTMIRQMDRFMDDLPQGEKVILLGHNLHLCRDYRGVKMDDAPLWPTVGSHLVDRLGGRVYIVWLLCERGERMLMAGPKPSQEIQRPQGSLEPILSRAGDAYLLLCGSGDPREQFLDRELNVMSDAMCRPARQANAIFFLRTVHAPQPR